MYTKWHWNSWKLPAPSWEDPENEPVLPAPSKRICLGVTLTHSSVLTFMAVFQGKLWRRKDWVTLKSLYIYPNIKISSLEFTLLFILRQCYQHKGVLVTDVYPTVIPCLGNLMISHKDGHLTTGEGTGKEEAVSWKAGLGFQGHHWGSRQNLNMNLCLGFFWQPDIVFVRWCDFKENGEVLVWVWFCLPLQAPCFDSLEVPNPEKSPGFQIVTFRWHLFVIPFHGDSTLLSEGIWKDV